MQDEILKHPKKVKPKKKNMTFFEKFKKILIETFIIFFGVTLSIMMDRLSTKNHQQKAVTEFLTDLSYDFKNDLHDYQESQKYLKKMLSILDSASIKNKTINKDALFPRIFRTRSGGNYESFKSSGDIKYIENKQLKDNIINYYEGMYEIIRTIESDFDNKTYILKKETYYEPLINYEVLNKIKYKFSVEEYRTSIETNVEFHDILINYCKETINQIDKELKK
jgi:hypothetical protein